MPERLIHIRPMGNLANRMIQYMAARTIAERAPGSAIAGADLPEWGIVRPARPVAAPAYQIRVDRIDMRRAVALLCAEPIGSVVLDSYCQHVENFLDPAFYRRMFVTDVAIGEDFGEGALICNVRGEEVLRAVHRDYVQVPVRFYAELVERTRLTPVFMGQIGDNRYCAALRRAFPRAEFVPTRGEIADFQTVRRARYIVPAVSTFSWLAAWLSEAADIYLPVSGLFHPVQCPATCFLPLGDPRYRYTAFPINYASHVSRIAQVHATFAGQWRQVDETALQAMIDHVSARPRRLAAYLEAFDEAQYRTVHPDVAPAVRDGYFRSGREHFSRFGFAEFRDPTGFDRSWYSESYSAAAREVGDGRYVDLLHHYVETGRANGCRPVGPSGVADHQSVGMELRRAYVARG